MADWLDVTKAGLISCLVKWLTVMLTHWLLCLQTGWMWQVHADWLADSFLTGWLLCLPSGFMLEWAYGSFADYLSVLLTGLLLH